MSTGPVWIGNPHFPSIISSKQSCSWLIVNDSRYPRKNVTVHFLYFDMVSVTAQGCAGNHVNISSKEGVIRMICARSDHQVLNVTERLFSIWFQATALGIFRGFHMKLTLS